MPQELADSFNGGGGEGVDDNHSEEFKDTLTWIKGRHTIKFGMDYQKGADNTISPGRNAGYFQFTNTETGLLQHSRQRFGLCLLPAGICFHGE